MHVHVSSPDGEAKFWIEPKVALATHSMRVLHCSILLVCAACSTSSMRASSTGGDAGSEQPIHCDPITQNVFAFDDANACFDPVAVLDGICRQAASSTRTTGLENVCAVKDGTLYLITVGTDEILTGDGWTFGPRAAPDVVPQSSSLSAADETRCANAQQVPRTHACGGDGG